MIATDGSNRSQGMKDIRNGALITVVVGLAAWSLVFWWLAEFVK